MNIVAVQVETVLRGDKVFFDAQAVNILNDLLITTEAHLVLVGGWGNLQVCGIDLKSTKLLLKAFNVKAERLVGSFAKSADFHLWCKINNVTNFVVLSSLTSFPNNVLVTKGLDDMIFSQAVRILRRI
jgi:hypothetical protein